MRPIYILAKVFCFWISYIFRKILIMCEAKFFAVVIAQVVRIWLHEQEASTALLLTIWNMHCITCTVERACSITSYKTSLHLCTVVTLLYAAAKAIVHCTHKYPSISEIGLGQASSWATCRRRPFLQGWCSGQACSIRNNGVVPFH